MHPTESSSFVVDLDPFLMIWTMFVFAFAIVLAVMLVVMFRRRRSAFKSPASERVNRVMHRVTNVGIGLGIIVGASSDSDLSTSIAIFVPALLIFTRCAVYILSRNPRAPQQPALT